jgi:hypothetical protein
MSWHYKQVTGGWHYVIEHSNALTFRATKIYETPHYSWEERLLVLRSNRWFTSNRLQSRYISFSCSTEWLYLETETKKNNWSDILCIDITLNCDHSGSHSGVDEHSDLQGFCTFPTGKYLTYIQGEYSASETSVTRPNTPEDTDIHHNHSPFKQQ